MKSKLFYSNEFQEIEARIKFFLNNQAEFLSTSTAKSTRAVGDAIQDILAGNFEAILGAENCAKYSSQFARRAMADLAFEDSHGFYYVVDVKTHRLSTNFNMPNLTSVERLARFYEDDKNYFVVMMVAYDIEDLRAIIEAVRFVPIEFLGWDCLTIGALGWGQIQIANSNRLVVNPGYSRKTWMLEFCDIMLDFYPRESLKIDRRLNHFREVREKWMKRTEP